MYLKPRYIITHPCSHFNGGLAKPPLQLGHGWIIISHIKKIMWLLILALIPVSVSEHVHIYLNGRYRIAQQKKFPIQTQIFIESQIAKFMGPHVAHLPPGSCRSQMGPMLAPWNLLSGVWSDYRDLTWPFTSFELDTGVKAWRVRRSLNCRRHRLTKARPTTHKNTFRIRRGPRHSSAYSISGAAPERIQLQVNFVDLTNLNWSHCGWYFKIKPSCL